MNTTIRSLSMWLCLCLMCAATAYSQSSELNLTLGEQRVKFAPTRSFQEMRLEVVNNAGETVFTHLTNQAEFDWNLRGGNGEALAPGLYRYALTLKFSEDLSRQHTGHFIVEKSQDQIWLTANEGTEVSGATLNAARSGGRSIAGSTSTEDKSVKRDVSGRETTDDKGNNLADKQKNARSEKASLLSTVGRIAKFSSTGGSVIDSVVTEDAGGDIGIGTTNPTKKLHVQHSGSSGVLVKSTASYSVVDIDAFNGDAALRFMKNGATRWNFRNDPSTDNLQIFETGAASRMVVQNTTGNVGIGTDTPQGKLHVFSTTVNPLQVEMSGVSGAALTAQMDNFGGGSSTGGSGFLGRAAGGSKGAPTDVAAGDRLGFNVFGGYAGGGFRHTLAINGFVGTGTVSATSLPSYLNFMTTPDGSVARLERMRIDQNGNVGIGTTAPATQLHVIGNILATGTITPSDARYKQHIQTLSQALDKVQRLRGVSYDWRRDAYPQMGFSERPQLGFLAQELNQVLPEAVHQDAEGMYSVNYTSVVPVLVEAVKEQQAMIAQQQKTMAQQQTLMARMQKRLIKLEKTRKPAGR